MKDKLTKKRKYVDWFHVRWKLHYLVIDTYYFLNLKKWHRKSPNTANYLALLHFIPKAYLDAYRITGDIDSLIDYCDQLVINCPELDHYGPMI